MRINGGAEPVRARFFEEGQVAGLRGVEHVGVVWCCLFTHHLRLHFCVFGRAVRCPRRCVPNASKQCAEQLFTTRAAQNMLILLAAEERCATHSRLLCSLPGLLVSYQALALSTDARVGAAAEMATSLAEQPRAWPGRLWPPSGGRRPRRERTFEPCVPWGWPTRGVLPAPGTGPRGRSPPLRTH